MTQLVVLALLLVLSFQAKADDIVTVELFTSQGCSSCPPADEYLAELTQRPDVVALGYHVDYWDRLITFSGIWRDPFSSPEWTRRQRTYSELIAGAGNPYTPQMVIDGRYAAVGSNKAAVEELILKAREKRDADFSVVQSRVDVATVEVTLEGLKRIGGVELRQGRAVDIVQAKFIEASDTPVNAGENKGRTIGVRHAVGALVPVGTWYAGKQTFRYRTDAVTRCALLFQDKVSKRIVTARYCEP